MKPSPTALVVLALAARCTPTFAPPLRVGHFGAPGRMTSGVGVVHASGGVGGLSFGGLALSIPVTGGLRIEASGDGTNSSLMGSAGLRYAHIAQRLAMDLELGAGAGAGGVLCNNTRDTAHPCQTSQRDPGDALRTSPPATYPDGLGMWDRFAFGGYTGFGLGVRTWSWLEVYVRGGLQLTQATHIPTTLWVSGVGGVQFKIGPVDLNVAIGWGGYFNELDQNNGAILELGLTVPFRVRAQ